MRRPDLLTPIPFGHQSSSPPQQHQSQYLYAQSPSYTPPSPAYYAWAPPTTSQSGIDSSSSYDLTHHRDDVMYSNDRGSGGPLLPLISGSASPYTRTMQYAPPAIPSRAAREASIASIYSVHNATAGGGGSGSGYNSAQLSMQGYARKQAGGRAGKYRSSSGGSGTNQANSGYVNDESYAQSPLYDSSSHYHHPQQPYPILLPPSSYPFGPLSSQSVSATINSPSFPSTSSSSSGSSHQQSQSTFQLNLSSTPNPSSVPVPALMEGYHAGIIWQQQQMAQANHNQQQQLLLLQLQKEQQSQLDMYDLEHYDNGMLKTPRRHASPPSSKKLSGGKLRNASAGGSGGSQSDRSDRTDRSGTDRADRTERLGSSHRKRGQTSLPVIGHSHSSHHVQHATDDEHSHYDEEESKMNTNDDDYNISSSRAPIEPIPFVLPAIDDANDIVVVYDRTLVAAQDESDDGRRKPLVDYTIPDDVALDAEVVDSAIAPATATSAPSTEVILVDSMSHHWSARRRLILTYLASTRGAMLFGSSQPALLASAIGAAAVNADQALVPTPPASGAKKSSQRQARLSSHSASASTTTVICSPAEVNRMLIDGGAEPHSLRYLDALATVLNLPSSSSGSASAGAAPCVSRFDNFDDLLAAIQASAAIVKERQRLAKMDIRLALTKDDAPLLELLVEVVQTKAAQSRPVTKSSKRHTGVAAALESNGSAELSGEVTSAEANELLLARAHDADAALERLLDAGGCNSASVLYQLHQLSRIGTRCASLGALALALRTSHRATVGIKRMLHAHLTGSSLLLRPLALLRAERAAREQAQAEAQARADELLDLAGGTVLNAPRRNWDRPIHAGSSAPGSVGGFGGSNDPEANLENLRLAELNRVATAVAEIVLSDMNLEEEVTESAISIAAAKQDGKRSQRKVDEDESAAASHAQQVSLAMLSSTPESRMLLSSDTTLLVQTLVVEQPRVALTLTPAEIDAIYKHGGAGEDTMLIIAEMEAGMLSSTSSSLSRVAEEGCASIAKLIARIQCYARAASVRRSIARRMILAFLAGPRCRIFRSEISITRRDLDRLVSTCASSSSSASANSTGAGNNALNFALSHMRRLNSTIQREGTAQLEHFQELVDALQTMHEKSVGDRAEIKEFLTRADGTLWQEPEIIESEAASKSRVITLDDDDDGGLDRLDATSPSASPKSRRTSVTPELVDRLYIDGLAGSDTIMYLRQLEVRPKSSGNVESKIVVAASSLIASSALSASFSDVMPIVPPESLAPKLDLPAPFRAYSSMLELTMAVRHLHRESYARQVPLLRFFNPTITLAVMSDDPNAEPCGGDDDVANSSTVLDLVDTYGRDLPAMTRRELTSLCLSNLLLNGEHILLYHLRALAREHSIRRREQSLPTAQTLWMTSASSSSESAGSGESERRLVYPRPYRSMAELRSALCARVNSADEREKRHERAMVVPVMLWMNQKYRGFIPATMLKTRSSNSNSSRSSSSRSSETPPHDEYRLTPLDDGRAPDLYYSTSDALRLMTLSCAGSETLAILRELDSQPVRHGSKTSSKNHVVQVVKAMYQRLVASRKLVQSILIAPSCALFRQALDTRIAIAWNYPNDVDDLLRGSGVGVGKDVRDYNIPLYIHELDRRCVDIGSFSALALLLRSRGTLQNSRQTWNDFLARDMISRAQSALFGVGDREWTANHVERLLAAAGGPGSGQRVRFYIRQFVYDAHVRTSLGKSDTDSSASAQQGKSKRQSSSSPALFDTFAALCDAIAAAHLAAGRHQRACLEYMRAFESTLISGRPGPELLQLQSLISTSTIQVPVATAALPVIVEQVIDQIEQADADRADRADRAADADNDLDGDIAQEDESAAANDDEAKSTELYMYFDTFAPLSDTDPPMKSHSSLTLSSSEPEFAPVSKSPSPLPSLPGSPDRIYSLAAVVVSAAQSPSPSPSWLDLAWAERLFLDAGGLGSLGYLRGFVDSRRRFASGWEMAHEIARAVQQKRSTEQRMYDFFNRNYADGDDQAEGDQYHMGIYDDYANESVVVDPICHLFDYSPDAVVVRHSDCTRLLHSSLGHSYSRTVAYIFALNNAEPPVQFDDFASLLESVQGMYAREEREQAERNEEVNKKRNESLRQTMMQDAKPASEAAIDSSIAAEDVVDSTIDAATIAPPSTIAAIDASRRYGHHLLYILAYLTGRSCRLFSSRSPDLEALTFTEDDLIGFFVTLDSPAAGCSAPKEAALGILKDFDLKSRRFESVRELVLEAQLAHGRNLGMKAALREYFDPQLNPHVAIFADYMLVNNDARVEVTESDLERLWAAGGVVSSTGRGAGAASMRTGGAEHDVLRYLYNYECTGRAFASVDELVKDVAELHRSMKDHEQHERTLMMAYLHSHHTIVDKSVSASSATQSLYYDDSHVTRLLVASQCSIAMTRTYLDYLDSIGEGTTAAVRDVMAESSNNKSVDDASPVAIPVAAPSSSSLSLIIIQRLSARLRVLARDAHSHNRELFALLTSPSCHLFSYALHADDVMPSFDAIDRLWMNGCAGLQTLTIITAMIDEQNHQQNRIGDASSGHRSQSTSVSTPHTFDSFNELSIAIHRDVLHQRDIAHELASYINSPACTLFAHLVTAESPRRIYDPIDMAPLMPANTNRRVKTMLGTSSHSMALAFAHYDILSIIKSFESASPSSSSSYQFASISDVADIVICRQQRSCAIFADIYEFLTSASRCHFFTGRTYGVTIRADDVAQLLDIGREYADDGGDGKADMDNGDWCTDDDVIAHLWSFEYAGRRFDDMQQLYEQLRSAIRVERHTFDLFTTLFGFDDRDAPFAASQYDIGILATQVGIDGVTIDEQQSDWYKRKMNIQMEKDKYDRLHQAEEEEEYDDDDDDDDNMDDANQYNAAYPVTPRLAPSYLATLHSLVYTWLWSPSCTLLLPGSDLLTVRTVDNMFASLSSHPTFVLDYLQQLESEQMKYHRTEELCDDVVMRYQQWQDEEEFKRREKEEKRRKRKEKKEEEARLADETFNINDVVGENNEATVVETVV